MIRWYGGNPFAHDRRIKDVDKAQQPLITVAACGRASSYLSTLAILLAAMSV